MKNSTTSKKIFLYSSFFKKKIIFFPLTTLILTLSPYLLVARPIKKSYSKQKQVSSKQQINPKFSQTYSKFFDLVDQKDTNASNIVWEHESNLAFDELIFSWNALRPTQGKITFFVSVKHEIWSPWHRLAEWGKNSQRTFINKLNPFVHTKHVKIEMQQGRLAKAFKIKAVFSDGANKECLNALFACVSNMKLFKKTEPVLNRPSLALQGIPRQSQMINHPRAQDLCSPASTSMLINYFARKLYIPNKQAPLGNMRDYLVDLASKVHDNGIDIYGNWLLNVAQAYDSSKGKIFYRVERLNSFNELYEYLLKEIPVAVSVRRLKGGATPYSNGHFMVIAGWNRAKNSVICIDPAFKKNKATLKSYKLSHFLTAWGLSRNLSYIPIPRERWNWEV